MQVALGVSITDNSFWLRHSHRKDRQITSFSLSKQRDELFVDESRRSFLYNFRKAVVEFLECARELKREYAGDEKFWYQCWKEAETINDLSDTFRVLFEKAYRMAAYFFVSLLVNLIF